MRIEMHNFRWIHLTFLLQFRNLLEGGVWGTADLLISSVKISAGLVQMQNAGLMIFLVAIDFYCQRDRVALIAVRNAALYKRIACCRAMSRSPWNKIPCQNPQR